MLRFPLIIAGEWFTDELVNEVRQCFEAQYGFNPFEEEVDCLITICLSADGKEDSVTKLYEECGWKKGFAPNQLKKSV
jgi:hypothetical protein